MKLYAYWRSSASWRVRIALGLVGLPYEYVPVHLVRNGGEQKSDAHGERNPMRQVPTLEWEDGGVLRRLSQSMAICEYLQVKVPGATLIPNEPLLAARCREIAEIVNSGTQPLQNISVIQKLSEMSPGFDTDAWCRHWIDHGLRAAEVKVSESAASFAVAGHPSLADVFLIPQLYNARRFGLDTAAYPTLLRIEKACENLPAFQNAHPDRQPDAPAQETKS